MDPLGDLLVVSDSDKTDMEKFLEEYVPEADVKVEAKNVHDLVLYGPEFRGIPEYMMEAKGTKMLKFQNQILAAMEFVESKPSLVIDGKKFDYSSYLISNPEGSGILEVMVELLKRNPVINRNRPHITSNGLSHDVIKIRKSYNLQTHRSNLIITATDHNWKTRLEQAGLSVFIMKKDNKSIPVSDVVILNMNLAKNRGMESLIYNQSWNRVIYHNYHYLDDKFPVNNSTKISPDSVMTWYICPDAHRTKKLRDVFDYLNLFNPIGDLLKYYMPINFFQVDPEETMKAVLKEYACVRQKWDSSNGYRTSIRSTLDEKINPIGEKLNKLKVASELIKYLKTNPAYELSIEKFYDSGVGFTNPEIESMIELERDVMEVRYRLMSRQIKTDINYIKLGACPACKTPGIKQIYRIDSGVFGCDSCKPPGIIEDLAGRFSGKCSVCGGINIDYFQHLNGKYTCRDCKSSGIAILELVPKKTKRRINVPELIMECVKLIHETKSVIRTKKIEITRYPDIINGTKPASAPESKSESESKLKNRKIIICANQIKYTDFNDIGIFIHQLRHHENFFKEPGNMAITAKPGNYNPYNHRTIPDIDLSECTDIIVYRNAFNHEVRELISKCQTVNRKQPLNVYIMAYVTGSKTLSIPGFV